MKVIKNIIEYVIVAAILFFVCMLINRGIIIKGLFMDDLFHWSWFPECSFYDFVRYYEGADRFRPVFDGIQYLIYMIVGHEPFRFVLVNKVYNTIIALFIYHFAKRLESGRIIAIIVSSLYLIAHFAYYQIGQVIGTLESTALFFSLIVLFFCMKLSGVIIRRDEFSQKIKPKFYVTIINLVVIFIMYFLLVFTHERYVGMALVVAISIIFAEKYEGSKKFINYKTISFALFMCLCLLIVYIRHMTIGKVIPAGTGGTYVEDTFDILTCIKYCFTQVAFIFGINIGPDYLMGVDFFTIPSEKIKFRTLCSIAVLFLIVTIYIIKRFNHTKTKVRNHAIADILFLVFIVMAIGASSVTIRVEMRFIYASFAASLLYLSYMSGYIYEFSNAKLMKALPSVLVLFFALTRTPVELTYRDYFSKVHCYVDQTRMNSLYDNTIGKFGLDDILHNKKIYIVGNQFGMTKFYCEYYFKIYDKTGVGNTINIIDTVLDIPKGSTLDNSIVLVEDFATNTYKRYTDY